MIRPTGFRFFVATRLPAAIGLFACVASLVSPLNATDPCGMVPPIYTGAGTPITRIGLQKTLARHGPARRLQVHELEPGLVDQRRRLERVVGALPLHRPRRQMVELAVDQGQQPVRSVGVAGCDDDASEMTAADPDPDDPADPVEKRLAGQPYLLLLRWRSMSHRLENAFPQLGQRWVPRWM